MIEMKRKQMSFQGIQPIEVDAKLSTTTIYTDTTVSHIHDQCEIYINVAGDVSFMVEDRIYPISPGDVMVTRPFEYHQCIYHSIMPHEHFWILFSSKGNEDWLDLFFARPKGRRNRLVLPGDRCGELLSLCRRWIVSPPGFAKDASCFFGLLALLREADPSEDVEQPDALPIELRQVLDRIHREFTSPLSVRELAAGAHISVNTLERYFQRALSLSPTAYIKKKRLAYACQLLKSTMPISHIAAECGFRDVSSFIAAFKRAFGLTPLQYRRRDG